MSNYSNNVLLSNSKLIGRAVTDEEFVLYCSVIPFVIECPYDEIGYRIHGEVWEVDDETLESLDRLEGHPNWYERFKVSVVVDELYKSSTDAWMYIFPMIDNSMTRCTEGDYRNYIADYYYANKSTRYIR